MLLTTLLISSPAWEPMVPTIGHAVTHSSILWISFLPFPCLISLLAYQCFLTSSRNKTTSLKSLWQGCSWRPAEGTLRVFIPDLTSSAQRSQKRARGMSQCCAHCCTYCVQPLPYMLPLVVSPFLTGSWWVVQCYFKGTLVYRVLYYQWFQTSGGLGTSPTDKEELLFLDHRCACSLWQN